MNLETMHADGTAMPTAGTLTFHPARRTRRARRHLRRPGTRTSLRYDSLLAKVVVRAPTLSSALVKAERALGEFVIGGPETNIELLRAVLTDPEFVSGPVDTGFLDRRLADLLPETVAIDPTTPSSALETGSGPRSPR